MEYKADPSVYLTTDEELISDISCVKRDNEIVEFIKNFPKVKVLDIGTRNPFTEKVEKEFGIKIENTEGDLDYELISPGSGYDLIICSHVIEHVMNPLLLVGNIKKKLLPNGILVVAYPIRFKKFYRHFHEIPRHDMINLVYKAGMKITKWTEYKAMKNFPLMPPGIRPTIKYFYDKNIIFSAVKVNQFESFKISIK